MPMRRVRKGKSVSVKYAELAVAVPQVVAHRLMRAALAGPIMSERDRKEFQRMFYEKQVAYVQASSEMALQMFRINLELGSAMFRAFSTPWHRVPSAAVTFSQT